MNDFEFVTIDKRKKAPLSRQLYEELRDAVLSGRLVEGVRLPSSRSLAEQAKVSRTTVLSAFDQLIAEGFLSTVTGSGTFVSSEIQQGQFSLVAKRRKEPNTLATQNLEVESVSISIIGDNLKELESNRSFETGLKPFRICMPALDEFPLELWAQLSRNACKRISPNELTYRNPIGCLNLRTSIAEYLAASRGVICEPSQVMIVGGTMQAVDLIARLLVNPGDRVLCENPGYSASRNVFAANGSQICPITIDDHGARLPAVKNRLRNPFKIASLTPSHQFPLGITMTIERRLEWLDWARENNCWILEDDYDSEYRYSQKPVPAMQGLDQTGRTIYVGSFSKVIFPALSIGYIVVPQSLCETFERGCTLLTRPPSVLEQSVLAQFILEGHFVRHLRRMRRTHRQRRDVFLDRMKELLGTKLEMVGDHAGLHCAARFLKPQSETDVEVCQRLERNNIITQPLSQQFITGTPTSQVLQGLMLGFASSKPGSIKYAVSQLCKLL